MTPKTFCFALPEEATEGRRQGAQERAESERLNPRGYRVDATASRIGFVAGGPGYHADDFDHFMDSCLEVECLCDFLTLIDPGRRVFSS